MSVIDLFKLSGRVALVTGGAGIYGVRARPFIDAGVPVFIDKPLTDRADHLSQFVKWQASGKAILSSSVMRYAEEFSEARRKSSEIGTPRLITMTMVKSWERYGIHAAEGVYPFLSAVVG